MSVHELPSNRLGQGHTTIARVTLIYRCLDIWANKHTSLAKQQLSIIVTADNNRSGQWHVSTKIFTRKYHPIQLN